MEKINQMSKTFRAWHPEMKTMVYSTNEAFYDKREFYPFCFPIGFSHYPEWGWIIMRGIPLKDRHGTDIYEGDVLKRVGSRDNFTGRPMTEDEIIKVEYILVELKLIIDKFGQSTFGFSVNTQQTYSERSTPATYEIIGNIYQMPELITKINIHE